MAFDHTRKAGRWCVFTSAGDHHNVAAWISGAAERGWDLIVAFYGDDEATYDRLKSCSTTIFRSKGSKFQNLKRFFVEQPERLSAYDFIFVTDDDLHITADQIDRLFEIAASYDFWVCQPAFSSDGRVSHPITQRLGFHVRITNFVEVTCPVFRSDKLVQFLQVYDGELVGWGIDWWYCNHLDANRNRKFAVVDEVTVINPHAHQRPGGRREIDRLQSSDARIASWRETANRFGLAEYPLLNLASIDDHGSLSVGAAGETGEDPENAGEAPSLSLAETVRKERDWLKLELAASISSRLEVVWELERLRGRRRNRRFSLPWRKG